MKKLISVMMALCLLCTAAAALADAVPSFEDMPYPVVEDDNTTVELSAFNGTWVADKTFVDTVYVDAETLKTTFGVTIPTITIEDGSFFYDEDNGEGGTVNRGYACTFQAGQLQGEAEGINYCFDTLEDGNIMMTMFLPGEGDKQTEVEIFLVRADA